MEVGETRTPRAAPPAQEQRETEKTTTAPPKPRAPYTTAGRSPACTGEKRAPSGPSPRPP